MTDQMRFSLLRIIRHNGDVSYLVEKGYRFAQLALFITELIDDEYIELREDGAIKITRKGTESLNLYGDRKKIPMASRWITRKTGYWHTPMNKDDIYIPHKL